MSDGQADGPPPETHMMIEGPIVWSGGYVIRCSECAAERGWRLTVHPDTDPGHAPADVADLTCPDGHTQQHPLIYPDVVRALFSAYSDGGLTEQKVTAALTAIGWRPHNRIIRHGAVTYLPWEYLPGPDESTWPDLCWVYQGGILPWPPVLWASSARWPPRGGSSPLISSARCRPACAPASAGLAPTRGCAHNGEVPAPREALPGASARRSQVTPAGADAQRPVATGPSYGDGPGMG
jgi:hypothetical protein